MGKTRLGQELITGLEDAIEYERGSRKLRASLLEIPEVFRRLARERPGAARVETATASVVRERVGKRSTGGARK